MRQGRQAGFTLIEMLTVVFLVGMLVGGVSVFITGDGPDREMNKAVERFVVISDHISELAILSGEPIGLMMDPPSWQENPLDAGWRYSLQQSKTAQGTQVWEELSDVPAVELDKKIELQIFIDDVEWQYQDAPKIRVPLLAFYSSGEVSPFEMVFTHSDLPGEVQTVTVDDWGRVIWKERQAELEERKLEQNF